MTAPRIVRLLLAALLLLAVAGSVRPAAAQDYYIDAEITSISTPRIDLDDPTQVVELRGTLTNVTTMPVRYLTVQFWRSALPITSTAELQQQLLQPGWGAPLLIEANGNVQIITQEEEFGPGQTAEFAVRATVAELTQGGNPLAANDAAYLFGVQVYGVPDSGNQMVGRASVALAATSEPIEVASVVELTATPNRAADGSFIDDTLTTELSGRLDTLLDSAERPGVSTAVDPLLYAAVSALAEPHVVAGEERPASGVALRWKQRVAALAEAKKLWRLPAGDPDLARARAAGKFEDLLGSNESLVPTDLAEVPTLAILDRDTDDSYLAALTEFDVVLINGGSGSLTGKPQVLATSSTDELRQQPLGLRPAQQLVSETVAGQLPVYLISTPAQAALDAASPTLRRHVTLKAVSDELIWPAQEAPEIWTGLSESLTEVEANVELVADLTAIEAPDLSAVRSSAFSRQFASEDAAIAYVDAANADPLDLSKVTLKAASSYVMSSRTNTFPTTVTNDLAVPIKVGVRFKSAAPQRIRVPELQPVTVGAGESVTLIVTPEASANGVTLVEAQIVTTGGAAVGEPKTIEITATDFGRVGWLIVLFSGAVVVGGTAWRIRKVRQEKAQASTKEDSEPGQ